MTHGIYTNVYIYTSYIYSFCSPRIPQWSDIDWSSGYVALYAQGRVSEALVILSCISSVICLTDIASASN